MYGVAEELIVGNIRISAKVTYLCLWNRVQSAYNNDEGFDYFFHRAYTDETNPSAYSLCQFCQNDSAEYVIKTVRSQCITYILTEYYC